MSIRRVKAAKLHPASKAALAIGDAYYDENSGVFKYSPENTIQDPWNGIPIQLPIDVTNTVNIWKFTKPLDIDPTTWEETISGPGVSPSLIDNKGGGMEYQTGGTSCNRNTYKTPTNVVEFESDDIWIQTEIKIETDGDSAEFYIGFDNGSDSALEITFLKDEPGTGITSGNGITVKGTTDFTSVTIPVTPEWSGSEGEDPVGDLFDGEWHTITIKYQFGPSSGTTGSLLIFIDGEFVGRIWMNDHGNQTGSGGVPTGEDIMGVQFGTHTSDDETVTTGMGGIIIIQ